MAVYKVIQDIESEDKLLGPLTFKGLVYAGIAVSLGYINFRILTASGGGPFKLIFVFVLIWPMILFGVLASPLGREQPTEVWLLSRIRFLLMSRKRVWNQSGMTHLVTITVPKKIEQILTKQYSQDEVKSRLQALANTLDSRGWAVKNVNINAAPATNYLKDNDQERLIASTEYTQEVPEATISAADDILDEHNNPTAQKFQNLINQAELDRRAALRNKMLVAKTEYLGVEPAKSGAPPGVHDEKPQPLVGFGPNRHRIGTEVTPDKQAAKIELSNAGSDLSVASISQLVNRGEGDEVAVALH